MTTEQALVLIETFDVAAILENDEEVEMLEANNPQLLDAYRALVELGNP